jgi:hypothetical protein
MRCFSFPLTFVLLLGIIPNSSAEPISEDDAAVREVVFRHMMAVRDAENGAIACLLHPKAKTRPESTYYAIKLLESLHSEKAIPVLCDYLLYEGEVNAPRGGAAYITKYPACSALVAIGRPSIEPLLTRVTSTETSPLYRDVVYTILANVVGRDRVIRELDAYEKEAIELQGDTRASKHDVYKDYDKIKMFKFRVEVRTRLEK